MRRLPTHGFTLIELITVIVVLAILSVIGSQFIISTTESYSATQTRARLVNTGRQALERMAREVRIALPYSVTITDRCMRFVPIVAAGIYSDPLPTPKAPEKPKLSPVTPATAEWWVVAATAKWLVVAALSDNELYGADPGSRAGVPENGVNEEDKEISYESHQWLRNSPARRFYLVNDPNAFCIANGELRYYEGVGWNENSLDFSGASTLITKIDENQNEPFGQSLETDTNRPLASFSLRFRHGDESVVLTREVALRNVP